MVSTAKFTVLDMASDQWLPIKLEFNYILDIEFVNSAYSYAHSVYSAVRNRTLSTMRDQSNWNGVRPGCSVPCSTYPRKIMVSRISLPIPMAFSHLYGPQNLINICFGDYHVKRCLSCYAKPMQLRGVMAAHGSQTTEYAK